MKALAESKEVGELIRIENRVHGSRGIPSDWRKEKAHGGGMIYDWGVHLIDQTLQTIPETIVEVNCVNTYITNAEVDDGFRLELTFESGKTAQIDVGTYNFLKLPRFYMQCESGTAMIPDWNKPVTVTKMTEWVEKTIIPVKTSAGITKTMAPRDVDSCETYEIELPKSYVHDFYRNFVATIDGLEQQRVKNCEVRRVLQVIEAAFQSDALRQRLKVSI
jgi:predicted dehydrogenase